MIPNDILNGLMTFGLALVPALFGIICHEVAHGWVACKLGDPTAKYLGRLTLNPVKHIDPMGLGVFAVTALTMPVALGWAKPVPVQARYFKQPREGMVFVALAGPMANLLVALLCALVLRLSYNLEFSGLLGESQALGFVQRSMSIGIRINCALAWFNLMPVPPLDGSHVVGSLLPARLADAYHELGRYGMMLIFLLLLTGIFGKVVLPLVRQTTGLITTLVGL